MSDNESEEKRQSDPTEELLVAQTGTSNQNPETSQEQSASQEQGEAEEQRTQKEQEREEPGKQDPEPEPAAQTLGDKEWEEWWAGIQERLEQEEQRQAMSAGNETHVRDEQAEADIEGQEPDEEIPWYTDEELEELAFMQEQGQLEKEGAEPQQAEQNPAPEPAVQEADQGQTKADQEALGLQEQREREEQEQRTQEEQERRTAQEREEWEQIKAEAKRDIQNLAQRQQEIAAAAEGRPYQKVIGYTIAMDGVYITPQYQPYKPSLLGRAFDKVADKVEDLREQDKQAREERSREKIDAIQERYKKAKDEERAQNESKIEKIQEDSKEKQSKEAEPENIFDKYAPKQEPKQERAKTRDRDREAEMER